MNESIITGDRVYLRAFGREDIDEDYLSWLNDRDVVRYSNQRFINHSRQSCLNYLESFTGSANLFLAIVSNDTERKLGTMTMYQSLPHKTVDIGIMIGDKSVWGKGLGLEAWNLAMSYAFNSLGVRKVTAGTSSENKGMIRIMEKAGMQFEACRSRQEIIEGNEVDVLYYAKFAV
jgi:RimJ/RimL family protein N-acetyltransferase